MTDFVRLAQVTWRSEPLASFVADRSSFEARFGPPTECDLDSNGVGLFDAYLVGFPCGLEVSVWRTHEARDSTFEVYANALDLEHILFHLGVALADASPTAPPAPRRFVVMRADDNGNHAEVAHYTSRCEADAVAADFEARGHKQTYWVESASTRSGT